MPNQVVELKACMGDASDNIKGIDGVGEKTALSLIQTYGNLENLYEHTEELKGKLKERVVACKEQAFFSREIATIRTDMDISLSPEDILIPPMTHETSKMFLSLGFTSLIKKKIGGLLEKQVHVVQIQKCFMTPENQNVQIIVFS